MCTTVQPINSRYVFLRMYCNLVNEFLCFASKQDAENFQTFVRTYQDENEGNGYEIYSASQDKMLLYSDEIASFFTCVLDKKMVEAMVKRLVRNRLDDPRAEIEAELVIGEKNGAITFHLFDLPERKRPEERQCCSLPKSENQGYHFRGRVIKDQGENFLIEVLLDYGPNRHQKGDQIVLPAKKVFRSFDYDNHKRII